MFKAKPSIRQKITFGYYAFVAMVIGLSVITLAQMEFIETRMIFGAAVHEFLDTVLEVRRFEKNYLLYERRSDYEENARYVAQANDLLVMKSKRFDTIASPSVSGPSRSSFTSTGVDGSALRIVARSPPPSARPSGAQERDRLQDTERRDNITTAALDIEMSERKGLIGANTEHPEDRHRVDRGACRSGGPRGRILSRIVLRPCSTSRHHGRDRRRKVRQHQDRVP